MVCKVICWQHLFSQTDRAKSIDAPFKSKQCPPKVLCYLNRAWYKGRREEQKKKKKDNCTLIELTQLCPYKLHPETLDLTVLLVVPEFRRVASFMSSNTQAQLLLKLSVSNLLECYSVHATKSQVQTDNKPCKWEKEEESKQHLKLLKRTTTTTKKKFRLNKDLHKQRSQ